MLDTGIDVPEVVNLVFFKLVRSKTKFWQMIGRGTRLRPDLFGPGEDKKDFFVFDFCDNLEFFNQEIVPSDGGVGEVAAPQLFRDRLGADRRARRGRRSRRRHRKRRRPALRRHRRCCDEQVRSMNVDNFLVRPQRRWVERYREQEPWTELDIQKALELADRVADLPTTLPEDDEEAKRFDLIILQAPALPAPRRARAGTPAAAGPGDRLWAARAACDPGDQGRAGDFSTSWPATNGGSTSRSRCSNSHAAMCAASYDCWRSASALSSIPTSSTNLGDLEEVELRAVRSGDTYERFRRRPVRTCASTRTTSRSRSCGATSR